MKSLCAHLLVLLASSFIGGVLATNVMESPSEFWIGKAQNTLTAKLNTRINTNKAKNIILFLGDGMNFATVAATRMYVESEQTELSFEKFPHFGFSKTYCVDKQVPDSACTATAYLNAVKNNYGTIGVNAKIKKSQCLVDEENFTESIASWAQKSCKSTGIVTTTRVTHASPAGTYAHTSHRDWESNESIVKACKNSTDDKLVKDIAYQLVHNSVSRKFKVILGGGRREFLRTTEMDDEGRPGLRTDGRNLIDEWQEARSKNGKAEFLWHKQQLREIDFDKTDYLLGLFENDHCMYNLDIVNNNLQYQEPSLTDMTAAAIKMLQKDDNGFFLFVEGGRIDMAHHDNKAHKALDETKEFASAVDIARRLTSEEDTLIVVTSDHGHAFTYAGEDQKRGSNILGMAGTVDLDGKQHSILSYANGPGFESTYSGNERVDISVNDFTNPNYVYQATVPRDSETHASEDVGIYASGPHSYLFQGSIEQNSIPFLLAYAAQIYPYDEEAKCAAGSSSINVISITVFILCLWHVLVRLVIV